VTLLLLLLLAGFFFVGLSCIHSLCFMLVRVISYFFLSFLFVFSPALSSSFWLVARCSMPISHIYLVCVCLILVIFLFLSFCSFHSALIFISSDTRQGLTLFSFSLLLFSYSAYFLFMSVLFCVIVYVCDSHKLTCSCLF